MVKMTEAIVKATSLPVTVKTRLGWDDDTKYVVETAERLQDIGIEAISIHGRTRKQMYKGEADWTLIGEVKNNSRMRIPVFGNGDIDSPEKALEYKNRYGVDGIMIGRASIGYPWVFNEIKHFMATGTHLASPSIEDRVQACKDHLEMSIKWKGMQLGINEMKRHYTNYFKGISHFKEYRTKLVSSFDFDEISGILNYIQANADEFHFALASDI
jgi:nifR3 family TIM-barrel protein